MTTRLQHQIELAESRVRIDRMHLKIAAQGIRESARSVVSSPTGLAAIFLGTGIVGALGGKKFISKRQARRPSGWLPRLLSRLLSRWL